MKMILGFPYPKRKEMINGFHDKNFKYRKPLKFMGKVELRNVYELPIDMIKYRLANGRTQAAQEEYLSNNLELPPNFFELDLESDIKHQIQHDILKNMLEDKNINLIDFFKKEKQEEPLIIDNDGFVINGNRRLCAMREVYYSNKDLYARFSSVDVLILPPCTEKDKDELEATLQIKQDIKANYSWYTQACMFRKRQKDNNYSDSDLARLYAMKESDIREKLDMLGYADEYLESRNKPKKYEELDQKEFGFKQIRKFNVENKTLDIAEKDIFKNVTFMMMDDPDSLGLGRIYAAVNDLGKFIHDVEEALIKELSLEGYEIKEEEVDQIDLLSGIVEYPEEKKTLRKLALAVNDLENKEDVLAVVKDVIERQRASESDKKNSKFVIKQIGKAQSSLTDALNHYDENTDSRGINEQLDSIQRLVNDLRKKVQSC
ncbi:MULTISPECIES: hypothetical protein [unclassified Brevibacillus]|uniref:hypothetical protein n=1 Tax=unclassified Brevibacillus TaxID=2684853 RepID=UPI003567B224